MAAITQLQTIATPGRRYGSFHRPVPPVQKLFILTATREIEFVFPASVVGLLLALSAACL